MLVITVNGCKLGYWVNWKRAYVFVLLTDLQNVGDILNFILRKWVGRMYLHFIKMLITRRSEYVCLYNYYRSSVKISNLVILILTLNEVKLLKF